MKTPRELTVRLDQTSAVTVLVYGGDGPRVEATLILAHGAGAGQRSGFMSGFALALAALGVDTVTFNFLYTEQGRRIPDRRPALEACYRAVIGAVQKEIESARHDLFIGGKSMGGRIATHVAAAGIDLPVSGLVLLGYPLHPPGRPEARRDDHLPSVGCPMLFVQGSRDAFGTAGELEPVLSRLAAPAALQTVAGGDHSFKVPGLNPQQQAAIYDTVACAIVEWIQRIKARADDARSNSR